MSMMETVPRQFFRSYVAQVQIDVPQHLTISQDYLPLVVRLIKRIQRRSAIDDSVTVFEQNEVSRKSFLLSYSNIKRLSTRTAHTTLLTDTLSGLGVPQVEQPSIIQKTFCLVDETAFPELHVDVCISDIVEYFSENSISVADSESILIDTVARESMEPYRARIRPATKSSIEGLEKLRLLDHSLDLQAIIENTPSCPICMEALDCLDAEDCEEARPKQKRKREEEETRPKNRRINEEGRPKDERNYEEDKEGEASRQQLSKSKKEAVDDDYPRMIMITRLPCLHHCHGDCIVHWLEINHVCPMCPYPMPVAETVEASKPS